MMGEKQCKFCGGSPDIKIMNAFVCQQCAGIGDETEGPDPYSTVFVGNHPDVVPGEVIGFMQITSDEDEDPTWLIGWPMNVTCGFELDMAGDVTVVCPRCGRYIHWHDEPMCVCGWEVPESWLRLKHHGAITFKYEVWEHRHDSDTEPTIFRAEQPVPQAVSDIIETLLSPWDEDHEPASYWMALRQLVVLCLKSPSHAWLTARNYELDANAGADYVPHYWDEVAIIVLQYDRLRKTLEEVMK